MTNLGIHLVRVMPGGMGYDDAAQLCQRLYCTIDGVPSEVSPKSKEIIAETFAELSKAGWVGDQSELYSPIYGAQFHAVTDKGHWIEVMASLLKKGPEVHDKERAEQIAGKVGFLR